VGHRRSKGRKKVSKKFLEFNENENTTYQNLWGTAKAVLRRKFIAMSAYVKNIERSQINNLMLQLQLLEKKKRTSKTQNKKKQRNNKNKGHN
jgi:hypothetical protein